MGGAEYQTKLLCDAIVQRGGSDVVWISRSVSGEFEPEGYRVVRLNGGEKRRGRSHVFFAKTLLDALKAEAPDAIYQQNGTAFTGVAAYYARHTKCRMVWHVASDSEVIKRPWSMGDLLRPFARVEKLFLEYGVRNAHRIVVQTHCQNRLLQTHYGRKADLLVRNFHPLPTEPIEKSGPTTVLWIANLKQLKQPDVFLRLAQPYLGSHIARFVMIGRPSTDAAMMGRVREFERANPQFQYLGELGQSEVNSFLATSHLLINTSEFEGFSNTFIQAWMRAVPVLSLNADPDGLLRERGLGYCAGGDEEALAGEMARLLRDPVRLRAIGEAGRAYALAEHTEANMDGLIELLERG